MANFGYARVSTDGQSLDNQLAELEAAGCMRVFREKVSGAKTERAVVAKTIARLEPGDVLVVDLTADPDERLGSVAGLLGSVPSLAFYSHVEADVRDRAQAAGVDLVVPRSRMAREGPALVDRLLAARH